MTKKRYLTEHDGFAKISLQDKKIAEDFFKAHVPQKIQKIIDWKTLALQSGTFIDEDYQANYTDILYRVEMDKQPGYLFVLCEHQSKPDKLMPFRILNYLCKIWDRHLKQIKHDKKNERNEPTEVSLLPLILPLTVYHGKVKPYPYSMHLFDLFQKKELAQEILLTNPFPIIDLTATPDDEILRHQHAAVMELVQKYIFQRDVMPAVIHLAEHELWRLIAQIDDGKYLQQVVQYLLNKGEMSSPDKMLETIIQATPEQEDNIMTGAEMLRQQGMQQGMQLGANEKQHEIAKNMLVEGVDEQFVAKTTGLSKDVLVQLKKELKID